MKSIWFPSPKIELSITKWNVCSIDIYVIWKHLEILPSTNLVEIFNLQCSAMRSFVSNLMHRLPYWISTKNFLAWQKFFKAQKFFYGLLSFNREMQSKIFWPFSKIQTKSFNEDLWSWKVIQQCWPTKNITLTKNFSPF